jgi:sugar phosphate permease
MLMLVRFLFGAGEAGAYPGATSAISRWFPFRERSRAQSVVWSASRVGGMISPLLVMPIQATWGWRASFYLFGVIGIFWCAAWYLWYRDRPEDKRGISADEVETIRAGSAGTAGGGHGQVAWREVLRRGTFWKLLFMYHCQAYGTFFYLSWLHTYLQKGRGFSEGEMKLWSALPFAMGALGNLVGGALSDLLVRKRGLLFGRRVVGTTGLALGSLCICGTALVENDVLAAVLLCLGYFSMDCFLPVSWAMTLDLGGRSAGSIAGAMNMAGQVGSFVSSVAFGYMVAGFGGNYSLALLPLAAMTLVSAITFSRIDPTVPLVQNRAHLR